MVLAKTHIIKKVLGQSLEAEGFRYRGYKRIGYHYWLYGREDGEWLQLIAVIEHDSYKQVWGEIDEIKSSENIWESFEGYSLDYFLEERSFNGSKIPYIDMETFINALEKLKEWIKKYFLLGFKQLRRPRYKYCVTQEMEREVYENRKELCLKVTEKYEIQIMTEDIMLCLLKSVLMQSAKCNMDEFKDTFLGLSALLGETIIHNLDGCRWVWSDFYRRCRIKCAGDNEICENPMEIVFRAWQAEFETAELCYDKLFVLRRKEIKSKELWDLEQQRGKEFLEWEYINDYIGNWMNSHDFQQVFSLGKDNGWKFRRRKNDKV